jgi:hypothetical protein
MTSEGPRTQKSTPQSQLGAPGSNEPAKGLNVSVPQFRSHKEWTVPFV